MTTGTEVPAGCLGLQGFSGPGSDLKRPVRNAHRWRLQICADYVRRLSGCLLTFARPVETGTPPPKHTPMHLGGGEGNRTPVQNASRLPELQPYRQYGGSVRGFQEGSDGRGVSSSRRRVCALHVEFRLPAYLRSREIAFRVSHRDLQNAAIDRPLRGRPRRLQQRTRGYSSRATRRPSTGRLQGNHQGLRADGGDDAHRQLRCGEAQEADR